MSWWDHVACADTGTDPFFDSDPTDALALCAGCPVQAECRAWGDETETSTTTYGVLGGETASMRDLRRVREGSRRRGAAAVARCGTESGYHRHRRLGEVPCRVCKDANAAAQRDRLARRRAS